MSDSQDAKNLRRAKERGLATSAGDNGLWSLEDLHLRMEGGVPVPTGAKFQYTNLRDLLNLGIGGGGSPVESMGIEEYLAKNNLTPQQFQTQYGGLPYVFNDDGSVTYDPSAQRQAFEYTPASYARNLNIGLGLISAITGAGLTGLGQGAGVAGAAGGEAAAAGAGAGALGDFSLAGAGQGLGGVGSAGLGLNTAGLGLTPELIAAGGGAGAMGIGGGLGLQAATTAGTALTGATMGAGAASGGGWWDTLLNTVTGSPGTSGASTLGSFLKAGGSLLEWLQSKDNADELQKALTAAADRGDPFGSQRPFYQNMLKESYTDPNFWKNNAVFKGLSDVASSDAQRVAAARGFNNSSNVLYDVADRIQKTGMNYATNFQGQLAQNAGAGISPGTSASIAAQGANQVMGANQQGNGALGNVISNIPNMVNGIKGLLA